jgi:hypothetical protein
MERGYYCGIGIFCDNHMYHSLCSTLKKSCVLVVAVVVLRGANVGAFAITYA